MYENGSMASLKEKLARAEVVCVCACFVLLYTFTVPFQARDTLSAKNTELHAQLEEAKVKMHALQQHLDVITLLASSWNK